MKSQHSSRAAAGLSLVELLMAATLVAAAGALLLGGLVAANRAADIRVRQALAGQALSAQLALLGERVNPGATSGEHATPSGDVRWTLDLQEAAPPLAPLIEASLSAELEGQAVHVVTYRRSAEP